LAAALPVRAGASSARGGTERISRPDEYKAAMQGSIAYSGTYSINDKTLIFNIEASRSERLL